MAVKLTRRLESRDCRCSSATRSRSPTDNGSGIRDAQRRHAVPAEQQLLRMRMGAVGLRRASPLRLVGALRAAVRHGQAVPADGVGGAILGGWQVSAIINKSSGFPRTGTPAPTGPTPAADQIVRTSTRPGSELTGDSRRSQQWFNTRAFALQHARHLRQRRPQHVHRSGHLQRRRVAHPELPDRRRQDRCSSGWRRSTCSTTRSGATRTRRLASPLYGTINTTRKPMRELQLGVKFVVLSGAGL